MKWKNLAVIVLIMFIIAGCEKNDDLTKDDLKSNDKNKIELDGQWLRPTDGLEITINSETGTFTKIANGGWLSMVNLGLVAVGDVKFKSLNSTGELQWEGEELWHHVSLQELRWADATFTLSSEGDTLTLSSTDPFGGTTPNIYTMIRKQ